MYLNHLCVSSIMVIMIRATAMRFLFLISAAIAAIPLPAQTTTGHYIVELSDAPAADHFVGGTGPFPGLPGEMRGLQESA